jgi:hypothetical protein
VKTAQYFRSTQSEKAEKRPIKTDIHKQEPAEYSEKNCRECWENYM